jgi:hypothetical protein
MKRILPVLLLSLAFMLPGCSGGGANSCPFSGLIANGTYMVYIRNGTTGVLTTVGTRTASSTGTLTVSTTFSCSSIELVQLTDSNLSLSASPSSINLANPTATVTITGQGFDTTYGMPRVEYFDANGFWVGTTDATSVWGGGTALQCNVPNLSQVYSGTYTIRVTNKTSQGYYSHRVGTASLSAYGRDRLDSDGDGWYDDQDCAPFDPYQNTNCGGGENCGGTGTEGPLTVCGPIE